MPKDTEDSYLLMDKVADEKFLESVSIENYPELSPLAPRDRRLAVAAIRHPELNSFKIASMLKVDRFRAYEFFKSDQWLAVRNSMIAKVPIPYQPHERQKEVHDHPARFRIIAAGRRSGKTILAVNEMIRQALAHPQLKDGPIERSWFICNTYKQAEMVGWKTILRFLPACYIKRIYEAPKLRIELFNGHVIEFKGAEEPDSLRGVSLRFVVFDEYGLMSEEAWTEVVRPMLVDTGGKALFIGTPGPDGSPHFHELYNLGKTDHPDYKSWLFFTSDNTALPNLQKEIEKAKEEMPPDIFKREFLADFDVTAGLIYDNFRHSVHVIPNYEPKGSDFIVGSIDPGLNNPTAALLCAWDTQGVGRIFWEYYQEDKIASENAQKIKYQTRQYKVAYWTIDRASKHRDQTNGTTVYDKYQEWLKPLLPASNDPGSVWAGIDEVKKLLHLDPKTGRPRLLISAICHKWLWEIGRYIHYKRKWHKDENEPEKPRKLNDHLMDCTRNMVYSKPWIRPSIRVFTPARSGYPI